MKKKNFFKKYIQSDLQNFEIQYAENFTLRNWAECEIIVQYELLNIGFQ